MGELIGLPEWLAKIVFVFVFVVALFAIGWRNTARQISRLREERPSPTREEFLALMQHDVRPATAEFLWERGVFYLEPHLAPHPDDNLTELPIDDGDWSMDWPREFAKKSGFHESCLPDWPEGWPVTIRNYGRWLDMGRKA